VCVCVCVCDYVYVSKRVRIWTCTYFITYVNACVRMQICALARNICNLWVLYISTCVRAQAKPGNVYTHQYQALTLNRTHSPRHISHGMSCVNSTQFNCNTMHTTKRYSRLPYTLRCWCLRSY